MTVYLADANVLVALTVVEHVHHDVALGWFEDAEPELATCPITQGALLRFLLRSGMKANEAAAVLGGVVGQPWHSFWPDAVPFARSDLRGVIGHRQVTDAYLAALARHNGGRVATLDQGLATVHQDVAHLLMA